MNYIFTIIATVYFLMIKKIKAKDEELLVNVFNGSDDFEEYSVCNVMSYFCKNFNSLTLDKLKNLPDEALLEEIQTEMNRIFGGEI